MISSFEINNRRYLGNKFKLLPFIRRIVDEKCNNVVSVLDAFSGTGSVSFIFRDKQLVVNDIMYCNYLAALCWFSPQKVDMKKIIGILEYYNKVDTSREENYMWENFRDTYFGADVCRKIGFVREDIERMFANRELNDRERAIIITSVIYAMDRIAQTCGHYDAYRRASDSMSEFEMRYPNINYDNNPRNVCLNGNINSFASDITVDLAYLDPPYNSRQYSDAYHLLENVARWEKPMVKGVARKMDRSNLKSDYSTRKAPEAFNDLVDKLRARYILLSYNNMSTKGNGRSNAKLSDEIIINALLKRGEVEVFSEDYRVFCAGKSNIQDNKERLFLCKCTEE